MDLKTLFVPERTGARLAASSKKRSIEEAAQRMAASLPQLDASAVYRGLLARERLGSTAVGDGVAIPHCRLPGCQEVTAGLFTLAAGVDFDAPDGKPVQIMALLLAPELSPGAPQKHLSALSLVAGQLESESYRQSLVAAETDAALYQAAIKGGGEGKHD